MTTSIELPREAAQEPADPRPPLLAALLPRFLAADPMLVDLVRGFEAVALEMYDRPARFPMEMDPRLALPDITQWMAEWLGLGVAAGLDETRLRALISSTMERFGTRGTTGELVATLEAATGGACHVADPGGVRLGSRLLPDGRYVTPASLSDEDDTLIVTLETAGGLSQAELSVLVEDNLPVGLSYRIVVNAPVSSGRSEQ